MARLLRSCNSRLVDGSIKLFAYHVDFRRLDPDLDDSLLAKLVARFERPDDRPSGRRGSVAAVFTASSRRRAS
jgi:hypothetical protein